MHRFQIISLLITILLFIAASACGGVPPATLEAPESPMPALPATEPPDVETSPTLEPTVDPEFALEDLSTATFDNPTEINHKYFPMRPGTE